MRSFREPDFQKSDVLFCTPCKFLAMIHSKLIHSSRKIYQSSHSLQTNAASFTVCPSKYSMTSTSISSGSLSIVVAIAILIPVYWKIIETGKLIRRRKIKVLKKNPLWEAGLVCFRWNCVDFLLKHEFLCIFSLTCSQSFSIKKSKRFCLQRLFNKE